MGTDSSFELVIPNRTLVVAVAPTPPYIYPCALQTQMDPKSCAFPGIDYEIFKYITDILNISVRYHIVPVVTNWGTQVNKGLLKNLSDEDYDTFNTWYRITAERMDYFDYSYTIPYTANKIGFLVSKSDVSPRLEDSELLFKVFSRTIWCFTLAVAFIFLVLQLISSNLRKCKEGTFSRSMRNYDTSIFWIILTIILDQFNGKVSTGTLSGNFAMVILGLSVLLISSLYQGALVGSLIRTTNKIPFNTMTEVARLVNNGKYKIMYDCGVTTAFFWSLVSKSNISSYIALNQSMHMEGAKIEECNVTRLLDMMEANPNYIYPGIDLLIGGLNLAKGRCKLTFVQDEESSTIAEPAFIFRKKDPFVGPISAVLAGMSAMVYTTEQKYIEYETDRNRRFCDDEIIREGDPLVMRHFFAIFAVCGMLIGISTGFLVIEIGYHTVARFHSSSTKAKT